MFLPHLSGLPHLPAVPHLHANRPLKGHPGVLILKIIEWSAQIQNFTSWHSRG